ncbi:hypothetical protein LPB140_04175 [Sphingorhabdus lutea]|uniref:HIG1 domain-containing protein n=1 Tax=Sphingorhabdus lutea TaxID=1913578 RepID=A0A1L3JAH5_9SPHN|nr:HIG1 domain-containing protein [Sphingorhabdus lutea]APG62134.1 hypothetical protein LPB140_04175 [Sphingorhabdus lutea]
MGYILIIGIILAAGAVVFALVRGLHAFANMDVNDVDENGIPKGLEKQNGMMFARVKWQAITVIMIAALLLFASGK